MTREEQIEKYSKSYTLTVFGELDDFSDVTDAYIDGAKWADETMIEKVCDWIKTHIEEYYTYDVWKGDCIDTETLINDFKKEMEGKNE